ncbi:MAG: UPF0149 family protein [Candidatus Marinimicrobia bacterium]|nr:UPF0149 family protein [Candidatus Neomarinimicrobiota bacterium]
MKKALTQKDIISLEKFLSSDKTPTGCMNLYSLHGFLTCLMVGPETMLPSQWLPVIWGETESDQIIWDPMEDAEKFIGFIMTYSNMIASAIHNNPTSYKPLIIEQNATHYKKMHMKDWCEGFITGINLSYDDWLPILESEEDGTLLAPFYLFTTEEGNKSMAEDEEFKSYTPEKWEKVFSLIVQKIHNFWLPHRDLMHKATHKAVSQKVGRNEPCPCGSGKKYKYCCLN